LEYLAAEEQRLKDWEATLAKDREEVGEARKNVTALIDHLDAKQKKVQRQMAQLEEQGTELASRVELLAQLESVQATLDQEKQALVKLQRERDYLLTRLELIRTNGKKERDLQRVEYRALNDAFKRFRDETETNQIVLKREDEASAAAFKELKFEANAFLRNCKVMVCSPGNDVGVMVVGEQGWKEEDLENQVRAREGKTLRVYSHFMFLHGMAMGADPFDVWTEKELLAVGQNHPALSFLSKLGFDWPSCEVEPGFMQSLDASNWPDEGMLKHFGRGARGR
jgi:hypothetical protein